MFLSHAYLRFMKAASNETPELVSVSLNLEYDSIKLTKSLAIIVDVISDDKQYGLYSLLFFRTMACTLIMPDIAPKQTPVLYMPFLLSDVESELDSIKDIYSLQAVYIVSLFTGSALLLVA